MKYKTKKSAFLVIFLLGLVGGISFVNADLDRKFRKNFSQIEEKRCQSLIGYDLSDQVLVPDKEESWYWVGKSLEFHDRVNCFLNRSLDKLIKDYKREAEFDPGGYRKALPLETIEADESSCRDRSLQNEQNKKGFHTECPSGSKSFSSCQVAETILNEWCGYHFFLLNKQADNQSFLQNIWGKKDSTDHGELKKSDKKKSLKEWNPTYAALATIFEPPLTGKITDQTIFQEQSRKLYQMEIERTEKALLETLDWYRRFELNYRVHVWMVAELEKIKDIQKQIQTLRGSYATFPTKFINASSPF